MLKTLIYISKDKRDNCKTFETLLCCYYFCCDFNELHKAIPKLFKFIYIHFHW